jgi:hypothetical protein
MRTPSNVYMVTHFIELSLNDSYDFEVDFEADVEAYWF